LVEQGANVNQSKRYGETPLYYACKNGHEAMVKYLVEQGAEINISECNYIPLHGACENGNEAIVDYLVEREADLNINTSETNDSPLHIACRHGHESIVKYLVEHGANVNTINRDRRTPLHEALALECVHEKIVNDLVEHGASVNQKDSKGKTPFHLALDNGNKNIIKYLISNGAKEKNTFKKWIHRLKI